MSGNDYKTLKLVVCELLLVAVAVSWYVPGPRMWPPMCPLNWKLFTPLVAVSAI
jgi:hypothetical protein